MIDHAKARYGNRTTPNAQNPNAAKAQPATRRGTEPKGSNYETDPIILHCTGDVPAIRKGHGTTRRFKPAPRDIPTDTQEHSDGARDILLTHRKFDLRRGE